MPIRYLSGVNVDSNTLVVDAVNNRVGINTASPDYALDLGTSGTGNQIRARRIYTNGTGTDSGYTLDSTLIFQGASNSFNITNPGSYPSVAFTINSSGNVGIGTTSPDAPLEIYRSQARTSMTGTAFGTLHIDGGDTSGYISSITLAQYNNVPISIIGTKTDTSAGTTIFFGTSNSYVSGVTNTAMVIRYDGNVGIGTTSPAYKLHVVGGAAVQDGDLRLTQGYGITWNNGDNYIKGISGYHLQFTTYDGVSAQTEVMRLTGGTAASGGARVGIGTTSPAALLEVDNQTYSATNAIANFVNGNNPVRVSYDTVVIAQTDVATLSLVETIDGTQVNEQKLTFSVGDGNAVIRSTSNVSNGIYINVAAVNSDPGYQTTSGLNAIRILNSGNSIFNYNVGIGTTSPAYRLTVNDSTTDPIAYFGLLPTNASSKNSLIILQSGTIPQSGSDTTGEVGFLFKHSYGTGGVNGTANGGYIESIRESVFGITSQVNTALVFGTSAANTDGERMRITSAGNVGIGTTAPANTLQIGSVGATGYSGNKFAIGDGTNVVVLHTAAVSYLTANGDIVVGAGGNTTNQLYVKSGGNVGIGTSSPASLLHIYGSNPRNFIQDSGTGYPYVQLNNSSGSFYLSIDSSSGSGFGSAYGRYLYSEGAYPIILVTNSAERLRITSDGNVGIGTTNPNTKLHLWTGTTGNSIEALRLTSSYAGTGDGPLLRFTNYLSYATNPNAGEYNLAGIRAFDFASAWGGGLQFLTAVDTNGGGNLTAAMTITSAQNVGIGTTSPGHKLSVFGGDAIFTQYTGTGNGSSLTIVNSTTTSDGTALQASYFGSGGYGPLKFEVGGSERMRITSAGNVGIGTTAPNEKLHVSGNVHAYAAGGIDAGLFASTSAGSTTIAIRSSGITHFNGGNVGIGTTAPGYRLHVKDSTNIGTIAIGNDTYPGLIYSNAGTGEFRIDNRSSAAGGYITFYPNGEAATIGSEAMRITTAGNVGIGDTDTYGVRMHIAGVGAATSTGTGSSNIVMLLRDTTAGAQNVGAGIAFAGNDGANTGVTFATINGRKENATSGNYASYLSFQTRLNGDNLTERMRITAAGNVGIGTTAPKSKLQIVGPTLTVNNENTYAVWVSDTGDDTKALLLGYDLVNDVGVIQAVDQALSWKSISIASNGGNVGIGTTAPGAKLDVNGDIWLSETGRLQGRAYPYDTTVGSGADASTAIIEAGSTAGYRSRIALAGGSATDPNTIKFLTASSERMRITSAGNVGIGTTSPSSLLSLSKTGLVDFQLNASDQATDEKNWVWQAGAPVGAGVYRLRAVNDTYTNGVNAVTFTRSGISSVTATFSSSVEATSFIKTSGTAAQFLKADGTVDSSTYLTANQTITLSGVVTGSGTTAITTAIANGAITNAMLANSSFFVGTTSIDLGRASAAQTLTGVSIDGNAATATNVGWSGVSAGYKENYDLGFRPPNDSSSYAGFKFASPGSDANAGYFLVRGGADSDVYTQNGITLVADLGWLTLAQRTQSDKGIRFMTGTTSTTKMIILNNGNVGIGTTGPTEKLHVAGDGRFEGSLDLGHGSASEYSLEIGASRTGNGFAYVDLIGDTTYPDYGLRMIRNNGGANTSSAITHRGTGILLIETNEAAPIVFNTTAAERMRILSGGNVGIGTTAPQQLLHVLGATDGYMMVQGANDAGNAGIYFKKEDTTGTMDRTKGLILFHSNLGTGYGRGHLGFCLNSADDNTVVSVSDEKFRMVDNGDFLADGDVVAYSTTISDARYKTNIQPIESALDKVNQMRGVSFDWTAVRSGREFGVIAQEIEKIAPEVVSEKELLNGDTMKTVSYTSLVPFLIESIKELTQQVNELKAQLDGLTK